MCFFVWGVVGCFEVVVLIIYVLDDWKDVLGEVCGVVCCGFDFFIGGSFVGF